MDSEKRVLITGASGFIGRATLKAMLGENDLVIFLITRKPNESLKEMARRDARIHLIPDVDLTDRQAVKQIPGGLTHVIHAAALAKFQGASRNDLQQNNVEATRNLLDHIQAASNATIRRLLFTSTICVHDRPRFYRRGIPIREDSPFMPVSDYGKSKLEAERLVSECGLPNVIVRLALIYGPNMPADNAIRRMARICEGRSPAARVDFPGRLSVAYIDDLADALRKLLMKEILSDPVYFIAHPEPISCGRMCSLFCEMLGRGGVSRFPAWAVRLFGSLGPLFPVMVRCVIEDYYVCSVDRLMGEGIKLETSFEEGIRHSVREGGWFEV